MVVRARQNGQGKMMNMRFLLLGAAGLMLTACSPGIPDSAAGVVDRGQGVGFGNYDDYASRRDAALEGRTAPQSVLPPQAGGASATTPATGDPDAATAAALNSGVAPINAQPGNSAPQVVTNAAGISAENDFQAVSDQRDIADDAALLAQNRAQYQVITPTSLPTRPGTDMPNIVEYALRTTNPVGTPLYSRNRFRAEVKFQRACSQYASADMAQEAFLSLGGPERDREGMDPDGDGFACNWSPMPYRRVAGG